MRSPGARNGAFDEQQIAFGIDANDLQIDRGGLLGTQMSRHFLAWEDSARRLALADGAGGAMRQRVTVRHMSLREVVAFDGAREALAFRRAAHIDELTGLKEIHFELSPGGEVAAFVCAQTKLPEPLSGRDLGVREMPGLGLREPMCPRRGANGHLNGSVAIPLRRFQRRDSIGEGFDDRHRDRFPGVRENAGHAAFSAH